MNKTNQINSGSVSNMNDTNYRSYNEMNLETEIQTILNYIKQKELNETK